MGGGERIPPQARNKKKLRQEVEAREDAARKKVSEQRNVFVSFDADEDKAQVRLLASQAKDDRFQHRFRDYSVKEPFEEKWKKNVAEKMKQTSAVIVAVGKDTHKSKSVEWEIEEAHRQGKKVIGMRIYRNANHKTPAALNRHGDKVIPWDTKKISKELE